MSRLLNVTLAAYVQRHPGTDRPPAYPAPPGTPGYFTKYQFSGLMLSVGLSGSTPCRLLVISLSW